MIAHCPKCHGEIIWDLIWDDEVGRFIDELRCLKCGDRYWLGDEKVMLFESSMS